MDFIIMGRINATPGVQSASAFLDPFVQETVILSFVPSSLVFSYELSLSEKK